MNCAEIGILVNLFMFALIPDVTGVYYIVLLGKPLVGHHVLLKSIFIKNALAALAAGTLIVFGILCPFVHTGRTVGALNKYYLCSGRVVQLFSYSR